MEKSDFTKYKAALKVLTSSRKHENKHTSWLHNICLQKYFCKDNDVILSDNMFLHTHIKFNSVVIFY